MEQPKATSPLRLWSPAKDTYEDLVDSWLVMDAHDHQHGSLYQLPTAQVHQAHTMLLCQGSGMEINWSLWVGQDDSVATECAHCREMVMAVQEEGSWFVQDHMRRPEGQVCAQCEGAVYRHDDYLCFSCVELRKAA